MRLEFTTKKIGIPLKRYRYWTLYLSPKQYYLGKLRVVLKRKKVIDMCNLRKEETDELLKITKRCKKVLTRCFNPDLFNYATLGNCIRHHHWHIIPRYKGKRVVNGIVFKDKHWNNPAWPNPSKKINNKTMMIIHDLISKEL